MDWTIRPLDLGPLDYFLDYFLDQILKGWVGIFVGGGMGYSSVMS